MKIIFTLIFLVFSTSAFSGNGNGKVTSILVHTVPGDSQGVLMFTTEFNVDKAACSGLTAWATDLETESGQAMLAILMMAKALDEDVQVYGTGDCNSWGDRERPKYIILR